MSKAQRFGCQEYGRYKRGCPKLKKDNNNNRKREVKEDDKKQKKEDPPMTKSSFKGGRGLIGGPIYGIQERMIYM